VKPQQQATWYQTPSFNQKVSKTKFDDLDAQLESQNAKIAQNLATCNQNFETSESNMTQLKDYIQITKAQFDSRLSWATEAKNHYSELLVDFSNYKDKTNTLI